ncbi:hypothetical protein ElyMa_001372800 [Elysia marginata]|uniref:Uncharacterized protein n=1 Tax=Elysia marginata TaxID=1093978 RepID=A0AAV4IQN4_9GAST|nr:hypothetical protein ElyMa_001372800 [Elysia marginata]
MLFVFLEVSTFTLTQTISAPSQACATPAPVYNLTSEKLDEAVSSIVSELTINERSTSRARARYTSAPDDRASSRTMGAVSMGFIFIVLMLVLAIDAPTLFLAVKEKMENLT